MKYTKLGSSELNVSRICMGCMGFGVAEAGQHHWTLDEEASRAIIHQGLDAGINFFDTAIAYQGGTSEMFLGKAVKGMNRNDLVIATKFLPRSPQEIDQGISVSDHIEASLNASLEHLGMDYADLYIYHMWDYNSPMEEIMDKLDAVVKAGKVRYIGISNCYASQLQAANEYAASRNQAQFISVQGHYNLIFREEEKEMIPFCKANDIAVTPYSALAAGRLSKRPGETSKRLEQDAYAKFKYDAAASKDEEIIRRVMETADRRGVSMTEVSLAWLLEKGAVPVAGMTKTHHVEGAAKSTELVLSAEEIAYLEEPYTVHDLVGVMATNRPKQ